MMLIEQLRVEAEEFKTTARDLEEANRPPSKVGQLYTSLILRGLVQSPCGKINVIMILGGGVLVP